jgi:Protein of unknown function (DUF3224)
MSYRTRTALALALGSVIFASTVQAEEMKTATATVEVTNYSESELNPGNDGISIHQLVIAETFKGDIEATGAVNFLQTRMANGASFVGMEYVTGSIGGRKGTFVLQDQGSVTGDDVTGTWVVVPGSGTSELKGLKGQGGFKAKLGQHATVTLDYYFE